MDMSFANQALAAAHLAKHYRDLEKKVQAELALLAMERTRFQIAFAGDTPSAATPGLTRNTAAACC